jgi:hypothetical protein
VISGGRLEQETDEFFVGNAVATHWERVRSSNHWLDVLYNESDLEHLVGVRLSADRETDRLRRTCEGSKPDDGI